MSLVNINNSSALLDQLYVQYNLTSINSTGVLTDKLGDVYEDFVMKVFEDKERAMSWVQGMVEKEIVDSVLAHLNLTFNDIVQLRASDQNIPSTGRNGTPKTDVYLTLDLATGGRCLVPLSIKQSTVAKVAIAEYSVADIVVALGIQDYALIELLTKHQTDASAKNFTDDEKYRLQTLLAPYVDSLIRWCLTLSPNPTQQHISHPEYFIKFNLYPKNTPNHSYCLNSVKVYSIDDYISSIRYQGNGELKKGGFGSGLSWTYATGSKGIKIQFKA